MRSQDRPILLAATAVVLAVPLLLVLVDGRAPTGPGSAAVVAVLLFLASTPAWAAFARRDSDPTLLRFLLIALAAKLLGGFARFYLTAAAYGGFADAARYDHAARDWVELLHSGRPTLVVDAVSNFGAGTQALSTITGVVYTFAGRNMLSGFVVFSWLGFWGLLMLYRAFRVAVPDGEHRRYRILLFFLPSLVFWPSSIGKDAWMQLSIGAIFLGVAWLTRPTPRWSGLAWLSAGLAAAALIRPHIALASLAPLAVALVVRQRREGEAPPAKAGAVRVIGVVVLGVASLLLLNRLGTVFGASDPAAGTVTGVLDTASDITAQGGSEFDASEVSSITDLPMATVSVLLRPFIWEATSVVRAIAGLETTLFLVLAITSWRRLAALPTLLRRNRYLVYVAVFALVSIVGFSRVGNEGILARQRTQFMPAVLVLLCLPPVRRDSEVRQGPPSLVVSARTLGTVRGEEHHVSISTPPTVGAASRTRSSDPGAPGAPGASPASAPIGASPASAPTGASVATERRVTLFGPGATGPPPGTRR